MTKTILYILLDEDREVVQRYHQDDTYDDLVGIELSSFIGEVADFFDYSTDTIYEALRPDGTFVLEDRTYTIAQRIQEDGFLPAKAREELATLKAKKLKEE